MFKLDIKSSVNIPYQFYFRADETDAAVFPIFFDNASEQGEFFVDDISIIEVGNEVSNLITKDIVVDGKLNYAVDAEASDTYVVTITGVTAYVAGLPIIFKANTANTGACTINVNGLGAVSLKVFHDQDPPNNYIEAGSTIFAIHDGTNAVIQTPNAN